jgi:hypothetical protein
MKDVNIEKIARFLRFLGAGHKPAPFCFSVFARGDDVLMSG